MKRGMNIAAVASAAICLIAVIAAFAGDAHGPIYFGHRPQYMLPINLATCALISSHTKGLLDFPDQSDMMSTDNCPPARFTKTCLSATF